MPRARNIKPGFFANEDLAELPFETRLLFIGLWTLADREGRMEDRPKRIKMAVFPGDDVNVEKSLVALDKAGFIHRYTVAGGRFIEVCKFLQHQNPHHREVPSTIPKPEASPRPGVDARAAKPEAGPCCRGGSAVLIPDSLIPDSRENPLRDLTIARDRGGEFEDWWREYPRKVGKADAEKAWLKLKPDASLQATLLEAVVAQREWQTWRREGGRFIPHAATWLNAKRWQDQADASEGTAGYDWNAIARAAGLTDDEDVHATN